jgi:hypothetical protein
MLYITVQYGWLIRNYWNYLKFCRVIQLSISCISGCAQVKIFMRNAYTKPHVLIVHKKSSSVSHFQRFVEPAK